MTIAEAREIGISADNLLQRAVHTLDLSQVPEALREDVGVESALQLKEVLDRMELPPLDSVPDAQMVRAAASQRAGPFRWRYPNTEIEIVEIPEGNRQGQFLFSAGTVDRISEFYEQVRDLPYRSGVRNINWKSPDKSEGAYEYYISTPGYLVPHAHFLGRLVDALPAGLKTVHYGQTLWQWIGLLLCVLAVALTAYLVYRVLKRTSVRLPAPLDDWLMILAPITVALIVGLVLEFIDNDLNITGAVLATVLAVGRVIIIAAMAGVVFRLFKAVAETIISLPRIQYEGSEAALLRIGARVVGFLLGAWIIIGGIQGLGADLVPLLAGLGVGGLAVALAAKTTIANYLGGLILFANKPVRVGDICRHGKATPGQYGVYTVEEIGLISTRLRDIDRTITTIPNAEFSNMHIVNLTARDKRLLKTTLQLRYETTPEQLRYVLAKLRELLLGHPMVNPDPARARFIGYGPYSLDVGIHAYLRCQDENTFLAIQEDLLLRMADIVRDAGTSFAFPSQTAYFTRDTGLDLERRDEAQSQVENWRARGRLPFPEFEDEARERLEDVLDYPPQGSPGFQPRAGLSDPPPQPK